MLGAIRKSLQPECWDIMILHRSMLNGLFSLSVNSLQVRYKNNVPSWWGASLREDEPCAYDAQANAKAPEVERRLDRLFIN